MNGKKAQLLGLIKGVDSLIIPVYQRNYDWKVEQCQQLFDDLIDVMKGDYEHFFGSIVSVEVNRQKDRLIIDGQQRIATVSILLVALENLIKENRLDVENKRLASKIFLYYIYNDDAREGQNKKLQLIKTDQIAFEKLFGNPDEYINESNVTRNYNYFYERIQRTEASADEIFSAISSLSIIDITLDSDHDDAQKIFESLNSTGLDLNEGDKIRNFVLMNLTPEQQEAYYNNYWHRIEELTKPVAADSLSYNVSAFVREYLTVKTNKVPNEKKVHDAFKLYVAKNDTDISELLKDMLKYARHYDAINSARTSSEEVNKILRRMSVLKSKVCMSYFLAVCEYYSAQKISAQEFVQVFKIIESFMLRRLICGLESRAYNKIFPTLHNESLKQNTEYLDALGYVLMLKRGDSHFPTDEEFLTHLEEKDVMEMNTNNKIYLFARLEDGDDKTSDVLDKLLNKEYTIERIMPDKLLRIWRQELGANADTIHALWCNRLANLTIVSADAKLGNRSFGEKKFMKGGFGQSTIRLNEYIARCSRWTEIEMRNRQEALKSAALQLWQYPKSKFQPKIKGYEMHSLEEDFNFTGREIVSFSFCGNQLRVKNWADMLVQVLKILYALDSSRVYRFANNHTGMFYRHGLNGGEKIAKDLYVKTISDTNFKIRILQRLFDACALNGDDLEFELKPLTN